MERGWGGVVARRASSSCMRGECGMVSRGEGGRRGCGWEVSGGREERMRVWARAVEVGVGGRSMSRESFVSGMEGEEGMEGTYRGGSRGRGLLVAFLGGVGVVGC